MHQPENVSEKINPPVTDRCRLVFYGDASQKLPREVVLERLRRLLKDSPEKFQRRMAQMPLALLPETDRATAQRYQQILARKGIACRIEMADTTSPGMPVSPNEASGDTGHRPPAPNPVASLLSPPVGAASSSPARKRIRASLLRRFFASTKSRKCAASSLEIGLAPELQVPESENVIKELGRPIIPAGNIVELRQVAGS